MNTRTLGAGTPPLGLGACDCACHGTYDGACDIPGGCGSVGCNYGAASEPPERRCARGDECALRLPERDADGAPTGSWLAAQIDVERGLCAACVAKVQDALNHLAGDYVELTMLIGRPNITKETLVKWSPDLPVPISLSIEALRTEIDDELQNWAEPVAEVLGVEWDTSAMGCSRPGVRTERAARLLKNAVDVLLGLGEQEHPAWRDGEPAWAPEFLPELVQDTSVRDGVAGAIALLNLHRRAWHTAKRDEYVHRLGPLRCRRCGVPDLRRRNGEDFVTCQNCHEIMHWDLIPFTARMQIDCERALQEERQRQEEERQRQEEVAA